MVYYYYYYYYYWYLYATITNCFIISYLNDWLTLHYPAN